MSLAGPTADRTTAEHDGIESEDWPEEVNAAHRSDLVQFNGDGLNTGVRVLGMDHVHSWMLHALLMSR